MIELPRLSLPVLTLILVGVLLVWSAFRLPNLPWWMKRRRTGMNTIIVVGLIVLVVWTTFS